MNGLLDGYKKEEDHMTTEPRPLLDPERVAKFQRDFEASMAAMQRTAREGGIQFGRSLERMAAALRGMPTKDDADE